MKQIEKGRNEGAKDIKPKRKKARVLAVILSVAGIVSAGVFGYAGLAKEGRVAPPGRAVEGRVALEDISNSVREKERSEDKALEAELITAHPYGIEPEEITREAGPFLLSIDNHANEDGLSVELIGENKVRLYSGTVLKGRANIHEVLNLPPGKYVLKERNYPDWVCRITITP